MRIELRPSFGLMATGFACVVGSLLFVAAAVIILIRAAMSEFSAGTFVELPMAALGLVFFGLAALVFLRRLSRPSGALEIRPEGLFVSCYSLGPFSGILGGYFTWGFAEWSNLSATGLARAQGRKCLGLRLRSVDAFLASRGTLGERDHVHADRLGQQSGRILSALTPLTPIGKFTELIMTLLGFTGAPKSAEEKDILAWNLDNYGWNVLIPDVIIPGGPDSLQQAIEKQHPPGSSTLGTECPAVEISTSKPPHSAESRLIELDNLLRKGLITAEEHRRKRDEILADI